ncbi:oxalate decarboxylase family bicupin [Paracraurococcus lichenis]|uniref:Oxalate decarboxylase family bicupin n=1 Tax=Paracraurococcus lichenis TaxID=3064888 RepID=A0ABT9E6K0_9PROT|nr:oxalate decarboxylase family bicupin [Paracraurococcus sp. LOR1-02]MDO9711805.1 oxalate decarboxylase family bicupin [Paracraurococcus sp. LOR1-02]
MDPFSRRGALGAAGGLLAAKTALAQAPAPAGTPNAPAIPSNRRILGPQNEARQAQNPDVLNPPSTDQGPMPNLRFAYADSHRRLETGGWTREITIRELPISASMAGVNMRLDAGGIRELHWHKEAEWAIMLGGSARITAVDEKGRWFVDDVQEGDLWYFPSGIPHSIQGLQPEGCEFLLVFDNGSFSEDSTFMLTDWLKHVPKSVLAKNFRQPESAFGNLPKEHLYIFNGPVPGALQADIPKEVEKVPESFSHRMLQQKPLFEGPGGWVRVTDSSHFPASKSIAAAMVELQPGALRELHWHPNADEWQYYIAGQGRMGVVGAEQHARTFDFRAGDVGYVPYAMGHYIENTGTEPLRFLEMFKSDHYADISLNQWMAVTPHELVQAHLHLPDGALAALAKDKVPVTQG